MPLDKKQQDAIRALIPIDNLASIYQTSVIKQGEILTYGVGQVIYKQNQDDDYSHFLLEGGVDFLWNDTRIKTVGAGDRVARRALDTMIGPQRYSALALGHTVIFKIRRSQLQRAIEQSELTARPSELTVSHIEDDESSDWMVQLLRSPLFAKLSSSDIHHLLERMEEVPVERNEVIITQGDPGDYYYVIQEGRCAVRRKSTRDGTDYLLAELGPGDSFGEDALIGETSRNAQIVMLTSGQLLRLDRDSFVDLIHNQLIEEIDLGEAETLIDNGALWLDVRTTSEFEKGTLPGALNVPAAMLRMQSRDYSKDTIYVVCSDGPRTAAVATFILMQRGFNARSLSVPLSEVLTEEKIGSQTETEPAPAPTDENKPLTPVDEGSQRVSPDQFADTITGKTLADLIDEIYVAREDAVTAGILQAPTPDHVDETQVLEEVLEESEPITPETDEPEQAPAPAAAQPSTSRDSIGEFMQGLEASLRDLVRGEEAPSQAAQVEAANAKLAQVRKAAAREIRKHIVADRETFERAMAPRRERLEQRYDQLIEFANRLAKRKADIQKARKALQANLEATERLRNELDDIRDVLIERIESLDKIEADMAA